MAPLDSALIKAARSKSPWDVGNEVLYELCRLRPAHRQVPVVVAKIWLIGRSYAAAIERRRKKEDANDNFYIATVAPAIIKSGIDVWLEKTAKYSRPNNASLGAIVSTHAKLTEVFRRITGEDKRSLASKYLHFHRPDLFFIYDSRAAKGMRKLSAIVGRATRSDRSVDSEYGTFVQKCLRLRDHIKREHGAVLNPRQIDNLLLAVCANGT